MILVVGGHSRNIGKTSTVCAIIRATAHLDWTAIKITQYGHGECADEGAECGCAPANPAHPYALDEQASADSTDSGRYLSAGAKRSFWLRTRQGELGEAWPSLRELLDGFPEVIIESNSVLTFLKPDCYLVTIDPRIDDFKISAQVQLKRADGVIQTGPGALPKLLSGKPVFDGWDSPTLAEFVQDMAGKRSSSVTR